jgi:hypothetical protein
LVLSISGETIKFSGACEGYREQPYLALGVQKLILEKLICLNNGTVAKFLVETCPETAPVL